MDAEDIDDLVSILGSTGQSAAEAAAAAAATARAKARADAANTKAKKSTNIIVDRLQRSQPSLQDLLDERKKGWGNKDADEYYKAEAKKELDPTDADKLRLFETYRQIAEELNEATGCMNIHDQPARQADLLAGRPTILDLGMAPGGFAVTAMNANKAAIFRGITLDPSPAHGANQLLLHRGPEYHSDVIIKYIDITLLAAEMDTIISDVRVGHPLADKFTYHRLRYYFGDPEEFDLVLCGATQIAPNNQNKKHRPEPLLSLHLALSQLVLALSHIRHGGTMVVLLHRPETWVTTQIMYMISKFARISTFKPKTDLHQRTTSSFYLIAEDVQSNSPEAQTAKRFWISAWQYLTIEHDGPDDLDKAELEELDLCGEDVDQVLHKFAKDLADLSRTVWLGQTEGLRNAPWKKQKKHNNQENKPFSSEAEIARMMRSVHMMKVARELVEDTGPSEEQAEDTTEEQA